MAGIFIGYRRDDSAGHARALFDRLRAHFGAGLVFMDVTDIEPGVDFTEVLDRAIGSCDVLIAVIGREWLTATDDSGRRRLDDPHDFVRFEMATALRRKIRVIPVLVQGAMSPSESVLPSDIAELSRRQAVELRDTRWDADVTHLIEALGKTVTADPSQPSLGLRIARPSSKRSLNRAAIGVVALALLVAVGYPMVVRWWPRSPDGRVEAVPANSETSVAHGSTPVDTVNFGERQTRSASAPIRYTVTNSGIEPLAISSVTLSGAHPTDFGVVAADCLDAPVTPGSKCAIRMTFRPTLPGTRTARMIIVDNGAGSPSSIELVGVGVSPSASLGSPPVPEALQQEPGGVDPNTAKAPTATEPAMPSPVLIGSCKYLVLIPRVTSYSGGVIRVLSNRKFLKEVSTTSMNEGFVLALKYLEPGPVEVRITAAKASGNQGWRSRFDTRLADVFVIQPTDPKAASYLPPSTPLTEAEWRRFTDSGGRLPSCDSLKSDVTLQ